ncbi:MAG: hypothetical protein WB561_08940 [Terracidiphilus sp.]
MESSKLDELRAAYLQATNEWVLAIRAEEALATPDHSEVAWEHWDEAVLAEQDAATRAREAKEQYKDALRQANLGF